MQEQTKRTRGRPRLGNKLFARRLSLAQIQAVMKALSEGGRLGIDRGPDRPISQIKGLAEPSGDKELAETKAMLAAMTKDYVEADCKNKELEARIEELVKGNPNPQIILQRQEIAKLINRIKQLEG